VVRIKSRIKFQTDPLPTLGIAFFRATAIDDATDFRRGSIMNRQFIFMGISLVLYPIG
jgi:hypothetical protein